MTYSINDLPRFSPWPARLLGLSNWETKYKNHESITREFECEKWGRLLQKALETQGNISLCEIDELFLEGFAREVLCSNCDEFQLMTVAEAHESHLEIVSEAISKYSPTSSIVELGAGYGSVILALARMKKFDGVDFMLANIQLVVWN